MATRILYVITKSNWGGAQHYVYDLALAAKERGYEVSVAVGDSGILVEKLRGASIRVITLPLRQKGTFLADVLTFGPLFSLVQIIRAERPDIVHVNSAKAGGLGALAARLCCVPCIVFTAHGWEFNAPRSRFSKIGIGFFSWMTILLSHTTVCVSRAVRRDVAWMPGTRNKLVIVRNGVSCEEGLVPRAEARRSLCPSAVASYWVGMLSELHPTKRIDDAIRAFAPVSARHPDSGLFIIGEGKERERLARLIRELRLEKRVTLLGQIPDAARYLGAFDLFIHASQSEALGLAILEAGCASLPVVATAVGGILEIITDGEEGLLVPPHTPTTITSSMERLMRDPIYAKTLGAALRARVCAECSKEKMVRETFALYH